MYYFILFLVNEMNEEKKTATSTQRLIICLNEINVLLAWDIKLHLKSFSLLYICCFLYGLGLSVSCVLSSVEEGMGDG